MGKLTKLFVLAFVIAIYFLMFNLVGSLNLDWGDLTFTNGSVSGGGLDEKAAMGTSSAVTSTHSGLFWNTKTSHYADYKNSIVYFFGFISLPSVIHDFNLFYIHLFAAVLLFIIFLIIMFSTSERRYYE